MVDPLSSLALARIQNTGLDRRTASYPPPLPQANHAPLAPRPAGSALPHAAPLGQAVAPTPPPISHLDTAPARFLSTHVGRRSIGSATIPTAHHLVWLCCLEYVEPYPEDAGAGKNSLYAHAEFNRTLHSAALPDDLRRCHHYLSTPEPPTVVPKVLLSRVPVVLATARPRASPTGVLARAASGRDGVLAEAPPPATFHLPPATRHPPPLTPCTPLHVHVQLPWNRV